MQDMADDFNDTMDTAAPEAEQSEPEAEESLVVTIEGEAPAPDDDEPPEDDAEVAEAPQWVKKTRAQNRELVKKVRELEAMVAKSPQPSAPKAPDLGPKPTLESSDYDPEQFEADLDAWKERKLTHDQTHTKAQEKAAADTTAWHAKVADFEAKGAKFDGFNAAKDVLMQTMTPDQQSMILDAAVNPSLVVAALGRNPAKAKALAEIKNPVKFIAEIARLETKMSATPRAPQTTPEKAISGTARSPSSATANMEKLQKTAQETGDYTAYFAAKRASK